jgi:RimJ/RimL family protein N-acetyltransferase
LSPIQDSSENKLSWTQYGESNPFIQGVNVDLDIRDLVEYVSHKNVSDTALMLGIFVIANGTHIGNIKLEPIHPRKSATIGILIGEESWSGKGVGFEVISRVLEFCFMDLGLEFVELGVNKNNLRAIRLYASLEFIESVQEPNSSESIRMLISKSLL